MKWLSVIVLALGAAGCARHVVIDPSQVAAQNDTEWSVVREPRAVIVPPAPPSPR